MKNFKKLISAVTAFAMTATMFAGLGISADAEETVYGPLTYEGATDAGFSTPWRSSTSIVSNMGGNTGDFVFMTNSGSTNGTAYSTFGPVTAAHVGIKYDAYFTSEPTQMKYVGIGNSTPVRIGGNAVAETGTVFAVGNTAAGSRENTGNIVINGNITTDIEPNQWVSVYGIADFSNKTVDLTITAYGSDSVLYSGTVDFIDTSVSEIGTLSLNVYRGVTNPAIYFDNFEVITYEEPILTVPSNSVEVDIDETISIATVENAEEVTAVADTEGIVTTEYADGSVNITGVAGGKTNVTITATSADGVSVSQVVEVLSGGVDVTDVDVTYIYRDTDGDIEIGEGYTINNAVVGSTIAADSVEYPESISAADYRYVDPSVEDYTVVSGTNTIEVVYADRQAAVSSVNVEYKNGDNVVATKTETVPAGYYEQDTYTYTSTNYVVGDDDTIYAVGLDYTDDADSQDINSNDNNNPINAVIRQSVALTTDTTISYDVTESPDAIYYAEFEDALGLTAENSVRSRYVPSGGQMTTTETAGQEFYPITETGYYQIIVVTGPRARGTEIFASAAEAQAAAERGTGLVLVIGSNNDQYGAYAAKTVLLEEGDNLAIRGWGGGAGITTDYLDYIVVRRIVTGNIIGPDGMTVLTGGQSEEYTFDSGVAGEIDWSVEGVDGVTIEDGVLTVAEDAGTGTATITATVGSGEAAVTGTKEVTIAAPEITSFTFNGASAVTLGAETTYSVSGVTDQFGKDITSYAAAEYTSDAPEIISVDSVSGAATANAVGTANVTVVVTVGTANAQQSKSVDVAKFYATVEATGDTTIVDITGMVTNDNITGYKVTTADAEGNLVNEYVADLSDVSSVVEADAVTITAVYNEDGTLDSATIGSVEAGDAAPVVEGATVYIWDSFDKMQPVDVVSAITVDTTGAAMVEVSPVFTYEYDAVSFDGEGHQLDGVFADGLYNFEVTKDTTNRADIYVNGYMIGNNVDQYGAGRAMDDTDKVYSVSDIAVSGGTITVSTADYASGGNDGANLNKIVVDKAATIVNRVPKVYVVGDSLVAEYYGETSELVGSSRTGWGQVLENYFTDDVEVVNWANSGDIARNILNTSYVGVMNSAQAGDYLIIESGYNDANEKNETTEEQYVDYMQQMIDGCKAKGVTPILVSPNASGHSWGFNIAYSGAMRTAASNNPDVLFIDLTQLSYDYLNELYSGDRDVIKRNFGLDVGDPIDRGLHSSYLGAMKYAEIVAQEMYDAGIDFIDTSFTWSIEDGEGNTITVQVQ